MKQAPSVDELARRLCRQKTNY